VRPGVFGLAEWSAGDQPDNQERFRNIKPVRQKEEKQNRPRNVKNVKPVRQKEEKPNRPRNVKPVRQKTEQPLRPSHKNVNMSEGNTPKQRKLTDNRQNSAQSSVAVPLQHSTFSFVQQVEKLLGETNQSVGAGQLAKQLNLSGQGVDILIESLLEADCIHKKIIGRMPLFRRNKNGWTLFEREISSDITLLEKQIYDSVDRLESIAVRQAQKRIRQLPVEKLVSLSVLLLKHMGYGDIVPVERGKKGEVHLSVSDGSGTGNWNTAVIVKSSNGPQGVTVDDIARLRGMLHHYKASAGLIISSGDISRDAVIEGKVANLPPVICYDARTFAAKLVSAGIGVEHRLVQIPVFDDF
jgi:hypothetical protein